jgi:hypothetical protein
MLLLAFALFAPLLLLGFSLSFLSLVLLSVVMAHIKSTVVPRQSDDNVDLEVADASACDGVAGASSAFDQVTGESEAARGREDRENSKTEAEEDDNMDDPKTVEGDDADFWGRGQEESYERLLLLLPLLASLSSSVPRPLRRVASAKWRNSTIFRKVKPQCDEAIAFEDYFIALLRVPPHRALAEIMMKLKIQQHQLTPNFIV